jgi:hypothetical protein
MRRRRDTAAIRRREIEHFSTWSKHQLAAAEADLARRHSSWSGKRKLRITKKVVENSSGDVCSFYLTPHDDRPVAPYRAGQFLTFVLKVPGKGVFVRCYSLSDNSGESDQYRISIKKMAPPPNAPKDVGPGVASSFFHDQLQEGDIVDVLAPAGEFYLDEDSVRPLVLIAGGIGITPILSQLKEVVENSSRRDVWVFYSVQNSQNAIWAEELLALQADHPNFRLVRVFSQPTDECQPGVHYDHVGHIDVDLIRDVLPASNFEFYLCGPTAMLRSLLVALETWGVPREDLHFEAFSASAVRLLEPDVVDEDAVFDVEFSRSGKTITWRPTGGTLLEVCEANDLKINWGCRTGNCGTCLTTIKEGSVKYLHRPGRMPDQGSCLPCISRPSSNLTLDA